MRKAIILHGMPEKEWYYNPEREDSESNAHWLPWLQNKLVQKDILAQTPEFPEPYLPDYDKWLKVFNQFDIDEDTDLIGHSCGAGFLVRYLSENNVKVGKVVLVAPWINTDNAYEEKMFDFSIDKDLAKKTEKIFILYSEDEPHKSVIESVEKIKEVVGDIEVLKFKNKGHFSTKSMGTREIPEVLELLIK